jgi:HK97 family phage prohead protease
MANIDWSEWDGPKAMSNATNSSDPAAAYAAICAGRKNGDPSKQSSWALPYKKTPGSAPNAAGVRNALARISQTQGLVNKQAAQSKLEKLMKQIQAAEKNRSAFEQGAHSYRSQNAEEVPGGSVRRMTAPAEIRGKFIKLDGRSVYQVEGYATVFNRGYEMWDRAGKYVETMADSSLDVSLSQRPDVAFLCNHSGVTMARSRSKNPTLWLSKDSTGLLTRANLNAERYDVQILAHAIDDGDIEEMSFAFMICENGASWNDEFTEFTITQADINRGDVSAVNFGANPWTSINAARSSSTEWLRQMEYMPDAVISEALRRAASLDDRKMLFRDAAEALSDKARDNYMRGAEFNEDAATRAAFDIEDEDYAPTGTTPVKRNESIERNMTAKEIQRRLASIDHNFADRLKGLDADN